eukprot:3470401-Pleurochrysis_carterae.AAC.1
MPQPLKKRATPPSPKRLPLHEFFTAPLLEKTLQHTLLILGRDVIASAFVVRTRLGIHALAVVALPFPVVPPPPPPPRFREPASSYRQRCDLFKCRSPGPQNCARPPSMLP